jgi:hypothetical protein
MQIAPSGDSLMLDRGLGISMAGTGGGHSRESTGKTGVSATGTPVLGNASVPGAKEGRSRQRSGNGMSAGSKRPRGDEDEDGDSEVEEDEAGKRGGNAVAAGYGPAKAAGLLQATPAYADAVDAEGAEGGEGEGDGAVYCVCRQIGYGEMIGCDSADCEIEWVSYSSLLLCNTSAKRVS